LINLCPFLSSLSANGFSVPFCKVGFFPVSWCRLRTLTPRHFQIQPNAMCMTLQGFLFILKFLWHLDLQNSKWMNWIPCLDIWLKRKTSISPISLYLRLEQQWLLLLWLHSDSAQKRKTPREWDKCTFCLFFWVGLLGSIKTLHLHYYHWLECRQFAKNRIKTIFSSTPKPCPGLFFEVFACVWIWTFDDRFLTCYGLQGGVLIHVEFPFNFKWMRITPPTGYLFQIRATP